MKIKKQVIVQISVLSLMVLAACSTAPKTTSRASNDAPLSSEDEARLDEILTDRAIAQIQIGGELLAQLVRGTGSVIEEQALIRLCQKTAQEQGYAVMSRLNSSNIGTAFTKEQSANIIQIIAKQKPALFTGAQNKAIADQAEAYLKMTAENSKATVSTTGMASNVDLKDSKTIAAVKNLYNGFGQKKDYVKVYLSVKKNTGIDLWSQDTCTTFKKLDAAAGNNLLIMGKDQVVIAKQVAVEATGEKATQCMINRGAAGAVSFFTNTLHVPESEAMSTMELAAEHCKIVPKTYVAAAQQLVEKYGKVPQPQDIRCD